MAEVVYNIAKERIFKGLTDLDGGDLRALYIVTSKTGASDPDLGTLAAIDAVGTVAFCANAQRVTLSGLSVPAFDAANDRAVATATAFSFPAIAETALALIIFDNNSQAGTPPTGDTLRFPLLFTDTGFGAGIDLTSGGLNITLTNGWLRGT